MNSTCQIQWHDLPNDVIFTTFELNIWFEWHDILNGNVQMIMFKNIDDLPNEYFIKLHEVYVIQMTRPTEWTYRSFKWHELLNEHIGQLVWWNIGIGQLVWWNTHSVGHLYVIQMTCSNDMLHMSFKWHDLLNEHIIFTKISYVFYHWGMSHIWMSPDMYLMSEWVIQMTCSNDMLYMSFKWNNLLNEHIIFTIFNLHYIWTQHVRSNDMTYRMNVWSNDMTCK